jgi:hypothetical protein
MKTSVVYFVVIILAGIMGACSSNPESSGDTPIDTGNRISFAVPKVGQVSRYVKFTGGNYHDTGNYTITYLPDTLEVSIVQVTDSGLVVEEKYSQGSKARKDPKTWDADSVFTYAFNFLGDSLWRSLSLRSFSHLGWPGQHITSPLKLPLASINDTVVTFVLWKSSFHYCECYNQGYTVNYNQLGRQYARLNVIVDDTPMQTDGSGITLLYSRTDGLVRSSGASWWTGEVIGWDLQ